MRCICVGPHKNYAPLSLDADTGMAGKERIDMGRLQWQCPEIATCSCALDYELEGEDRS